MKIYRCIVLLFLFLFLHIPIVFAAGEFETSYDVRYQVDTSGKTHVTQIISLTNKLANVYATSYSLIQYETNIENISASDDQGKLEVTTQHEAENTTLNLKFNQQVVGSGKTLNFKVDYDTPDLANRNGQVWEVAVPKISNDSGIKDYNLVLVVPSAWGNPASIKPNPLRITKEGSLTSYHFNQSQIITSGVIANFGSFQIFDFILNYHLQNPGSTLGEAEIALPPDTAYQQVAYESIVPEPYSIKVDDDGNWLATYRLKGKEKVNITARGMAKIFSAPKKDFPLPSNETLKQNLIAQEYWPVNDPKILEKAKSLRTPKAIYDFVVETLDYDTRRIEEGVERYGAVKALANPTEAICMEFTDLFVTLARAAGIPARESNGYAYTTNSRVRPLGLLSDVLHAWPEYWDEGRNAWIQVDPTWGKTTGGVDYFSKTDLSHFTFVIHGRSSVEPYPAGSYKAEDVKSKDVTVTFGKNSPVFDTNVEVKFFFPDNLFWWTRQGGEILIKNSGKTAVYNLNLDSKVEGLKISSYENNLRVLPPLGETKVNVSLKPLPLWHTGTGIVSFNISGRDYRQEIKINPLPLSLVPPLLFLLLIGLAVASIKKIWLK